MDVPRCGILSVGDELVLGLTLDTNSHWLCGEVEALGWAVSEVRIVGDETARITAAIRELAAGAEALIVTGGLGPTEDDRTRDALAAALGEPLVEDPAQVANIQAWFARRGYPMSAANRKQAQRPAGADAVVNNNGTAPGMHVTLHGCDVFCLPGVPSEMKAMVAETIAPALSARHPGLHTAMTRLHAVGIGESDAGQRIREWMQEGVDPAVGTTVSDGILTVRICSRDADPAQAHARCTEAVQSIGHALGEAVYGRDGETLAGALVRLLAERGQTLALAESCTGGILADRIISVPGASTVLLEGIVSYANDAKERRLGVPRGLIEAEGAVSQAVVEAMAAGAQQGSGADYVLATSGISGPGGGTPEKPVGTTWIGLATPGEMISLCRLLPYDRATNRSRTATVAFELLRRTLLALELPWDRVKRRATPPR